MRIGRTRNIEIPKHPAFHFVLDWFWRIVFRLLHPSNDQLGQGVAHLHELWSPRQSPLTSFQCARCNKPEINFVSELLAGRSHIFVKDWLLRLFVTSLPKETMHDAFDLTFKWIFKTHVNRKNIHMYSYGNKYTCIHTSCNIHLEYSRLSILHTHVYTIHMYTLYTSCIRNSHHLVLFSSLKYVIFI